MSENLDFENNYYSKTALVLYKSGYDKNRFMKWLIYYNRSYYVNINNYDLMGFILKYINENC